MSQPRLEDVADSDRDQLRPRVFRHGFHRPFAALECNEQPLNIASTQRVNAAKETSLIDVKQAITMGLQMVGMKQRTGLPPPGPLDKVLASYLQGKPK